MSFLFSFNIWYLSCNSLFLSIASNLNLNTSEANAAIKINENTVIAEIRNFLLDKISFKLSWLFFKYEITGIAAVIPNPIVLNANKNFVVFKYNPPTAKLANLDLVIFLLVSSSYKFNADKTL